MWLQYAIAHIEHNIAALQDVIAEIKRNKNQFIAVKLREISQLKVKILQTLQTVIHVASEYTHAALPDQAISLVKSFILDLPMRWLARNPTNDAIGSLEAIKIKAEEHASTPLFDNNGEPSAGPVMEPCFYEEVCQKTETMLTFATDSLNTIQNVARVFYSAVYRVDSWLDRFNMLPQQPTYEPGYDLLSFDSQKLPRRTDKSARP
ncbi:transcriptional regulator opi1 [Malassezia cuniculi]|uniref:Transcriptional regulator opi1 n=1 Tax=Malassezia cuniculi TaxID=948313 RepID=A0AAF0ESD2_9BASI|nr:transcriptional regulator opi1 [Malassezia cuniculi]